MTCRREVSIEYLLVVLAIGTGAILRAYCFQDLGLSHFDEGIYAISGLWPYTGRFEPNQGYYSPPVFPTLVGLSYLLVGRPVDWAVPAVSLVFSVLTIPLAWWIGRCWWRPAAGVAAAWLVAVDGMQIAFARIGLTDAAFTFGMLLSLYLVRKALQADESGGNRSQQSESQSASAAPTGNRHILLRTIGRLLAAGLAVGFTWNIKYNGFLPLWLALGFVFGPGWRRRLTRFVFIGFVALFCYLPWAVTFHVKHGYATLLSHQRGYLAGLEAVIPNFMSAGVAINWFTTSLSAAVVLVTGIAVARCVYGPAIRPAVAAAMFMLCGAALPFCLIFVVSGCDPILRAWGARTSAGATHAAEDTRHGQNAIWQTWMLIFLVSLPGLYTFYLRLWLPTQTLCLLLAAAGLVTLTDTLRRIVVRPYFGRLDALFAACALLVILGLSWSRGELLHVLPESCAGYRQAAQDIATQFGDRRSSPVGLIRPPIIFYLFLADIPIARLRGTAEDLEAVRSHGLVMADAALLDATPALREAFARLDTDTNRIHLQLETSPSKITRLDDAHGKIDRYPTVPALTPEDRYQVHVYVSANR